MSIKPILLAGAATALIATTAFAITYDRKDDAAETAAASAPASPDAEYLREFNPSMVAGMSPNEIKDFADQYEDRARDYADKIRDDADKRGNDLSRADEEAIEDAADARADKIELYAEVFEKEADTYANLMEKEKDRHQGAIANAADSISDVAVNAVDDIGDAVEDTLDDTADEASDVEEDLEDSPRIELETAAAPKRAPPFACAGGSGVGLVFLGLFGVGIPFVYLLDDAGARDAEFGARGFDPLAPAPTAVAIFIEDRKRPHAVDVAAARREQQQVFLAQGSGDIGVAAADIDVPAGRPHRRRETGALDLGADARIGGRIEGFPLGAGASRRNGQHRADGQCLFHNRLAVSPRPMLASAAKSAKRTPINLF